MPTTPPPTLPTVKIFQNNTTPSYKLKKPSRNHIGLIDAALQRWKDIEAQPQNFMTKKKCIAELIVLCRHWLDVRAHKKVKKSMSLRKPAIETLGQQAFAWLQFLTFELAKSDKAMFATIGSARGQHFRQPQSLGPGYINERAVYEQSNKGAAPSMSNIHESRPLLDTTNDVGLDFLKNKTFTTLTTAEVVRLDSELAKIHSAQNVWFMPKTERTEYMLVIQDGKFYSGFNEPFVVNGYFMYAINEYGNLFCARANTAGPSNSRFNHSSFNAGKEVICAGCIDTILGVKTIDNNSGHYQPTTQQMHDAILMLDEDGLDLSDWQVGVRQPDGRIAVFLATLFKTNMNVNISRAVRVA